MANICVYAATDKNKPVAIIVPAEPALKKLASDNNIKGHGIEDLVHNEDLNTLVLRQLQEAGKAGGLAGIEIIDGVVLADDEWNPANVSCSSGVTQVQYHMLTPTTGYDDRCTEDQPKENSEQISERGG